MHALIEEAAKTFVYFKRKWEVKFNSAYFKIYVTIFAFIVFGNGFDYLGFVMD